MFVSMWRAVFLAVLATSTLAHTPGNSVHPLTDGVGRRSLNLVDVTDGKCVSKIKTAQATCLAQLLYQKELRRSKCADPELKAIMNQLHARHKRITDFQKDLIRAEAQLQRAKADESSTVATANAAKQNLFDGMVKDLQVTGALSKADQAVQAVKQHLKDYAAEAHRATEAAARLAATDPNIAKVNSKAADAKKLWAKMVEQQVALGRAKYTAGLHAKTRGVSHRETQKLIEDAKDAKAQQVAALQKVKDATAKVAKTNLELARIKVDAYKAEARASTTVDSRARKRVRSLSDAASLAKQEWDKAQKVVEKNTAKLNAVTEETDKVRTLGLKQVLRHANQILAPTHEEGESGAGEAPGNEEGEGEGEGEGEEGEDEGEGEGEGES